MEIQSECKKNFKIAFILQAKTFKTQNWQKNCFSPIYFHFQYALDFLFNIFRFSVTRKALSLLEWIKTFFASSLNSISGQVLAFKWIKNVSKRSSTRENYLFRIVLKGFQIDARQIALLAIRKTTINRFQIDSKVHSGIPSQQIKKTSRFSIICNLSKTKFSNH